MCMYIYIYIYITKLEIPVIQITSQNGPTTKPPLM